MSMQKCAICKQPTGQEMLVTLSRETTTNHYGTQGKLTVYKRVCEYCLTEHSQYDEETDKTVVIIDGEKYQ